MSYVNCVRRALLVIALLVMATSAQAATTTYFLKAMSLNTGNVGGGAVEFPFGAGALINSTCDTCGTAAAPNSTAVVDDLGNVTLNQTTWTLNGFGADFTNSFQGTTVLGFAGVLDKSSDSCVINPPNTATQYCTALDPRSYTGDWYTGLLEDGTTASVHSLFHAVLTGDDLVLTVRKSLTQSEASPNSWLQINFKYQVVPVPAAVWLFGSALGLLGWMRRKAA